MEMLLNLPELKLIDNWRVNSEAALDTPNEMKRKLPASEKAQRSIIRSREAVKAILNGKDHRLLVVVGPCSVHDVNSALEYAERLKELSRHVDDTLFLVMRVYFEKPRTTVGWKGLINDPHLNGSFKVNEGLRVARNLLLRMAEMEVPVATESLDPITPQYLHDLVSWTAIGARTTESQTHRELASGLSSAVGFKNGTAGSLDVAINAIKSSSQPHCFLGVNGEGRVSVIQTEGNTDTHIILRGGNGEPNYSALHVKQCEEAFHQNGIAPRIMVDCSHANSLYDHDRQPQVIEDVVDQVRCGNTSIKALMIESNLFSGNQPLTNNISHLRYGVSITDRCIDWETTEHHLKNACEKLRDALPRRDSSHS